VARSSQRAFQTLFRAVDIDDAEKNPEVSEDVQLVYVADDLRQANYIQGGTGAAQSAVVAENAIISLECRVRRGLEVRQIAMNILIPAFGTTLHVWTSGVQPAITEPPSTNLTALRTTGLQGLPAAPLSIVTSGTIPTGGIALGAFRYLDASGFTAPFFINEGQHFNVAFDAVNTAVNWGIRWRELRLFGG